MLISECTDHWSRFVIKQTARELHPKCSFNPHYSTRGTSELGEKNLSDFPTPIHDQKSVPYGWEWYEIGFLVHWIPPHNTTILCFDVPEHMRISLQLALTRNMKIDFHDPYSVFSVILYELLTLYDKSIWAIRDHICSWESVRFTLAL